MARRTAAERYAARQQRKIDDAHMRAARDRAVLLLDAYRREHVDPYVAEWEQIVEDHNPVGVV